MPMLKKGQEIIDKKHKSDPVVIDVEKKVIPVKPIPTDDKAYHETCDKLEEIFNMSPEFIKNILDDSKTSDKYVGALIEINELI